jgi:hypothetical protein
MTIGHGKNTVPVRYNSNSTGIRFLEWVLEDDLVSLYSSFSSKFLSLKKRQKENCLIDIDKDLKVRIGYRYFLADLYNIFISSNV